MIDYSHNKIGMQYFKYDVIEQSGRKKVLAQLEYNVYETELKIEQIWAEESIEHHGTDLLTKFLKTQQSESIIYSRIYGRLSSKDAKENNWIKSIPFFRDLPKFIFEETGLVYSFCLYYDKFRKIEITDCFTNNCIPLLIREHLINNSDMVFDLILQPHN